MSETTGHGNHIPTNAKRRCKAQRVQEEVERSTYKALE